MVEQYLNTPQEMSPLQIVRKILKLSYDVCKELGDKGKVEVEKTETSDRQCQAEKDIWLTIKGFVKKNELPVIFEAEDHHPIQFCEDPEFIIRQDLIDGTCAYERGQRIISEPIATLVAITPARDNLFFKDIIVSGMIDLRSREIWLAEKGEGTFRGIVTGAEKLFKIKDQTSLGMPVFTSDFYRRVNGITRFLYPKCLEIWNGLSSMNMLMVAMGEVDLCFNGLPQLSPEGQKGQELGPLYRILIEAGGYAMDMRTEKSLGASLYLFNEQTPVVMADSRKRAHEFWGIVKENFEKNEKILRQLWENIPRVK